MHVERSRPTWSGPQGPRGRAWDGLADDPEAPEGGLVRPGERPVRLRTLTMIRWIAVVGQAFTILLVHFSLEIALPLAPLMGAVLLSAAINAVLVLRAPATARLGERSAALLLGYDALQLTFLLSLTGGLQNPFTVLLLVPVTISATILSPRTTLLLCLAVLGALTLLGLAPGGLPWRDGTLVLPPLYRAAAWTALALATVLVAGYVWRVADEARRMSDALAATQMALAREQQLSALGGLAAAAAHELGSPLATIAVTARELARAVPPDSPLAEEVAELVSQSQRCREILRSLGERPDEGEHDRFTRVPLSHLLEGLVRERWAGDVEVDVEVEPAPPAAGAEPHVVPAPELRHGLGNLIDNALEFAQRAVRIVVALRREAVEVRIEDDGPGFPPEVLEELGEPYVSTRREAGGLGLGVFIANALLARTGATLQFDNLETGARVRVRWPRARLEGVAPEA